MGEVTIPTCFPTRSLVLIFRFTERQRSRKSPYSSQGDLVAIRIRISWETAVSNSNQRIRLLDQIRTPSTSPETASSTTNVSKPSSSVPWYLLYRLSYLWPQYFLATISSGRVPYKPSSGHGSAVHSYQRRIISCSDGRQARPSCTNQSCRSDFTAREAPGG